MKTMLDRREAKQNSSQASSPAVTPTKPPLSPMGESPPSSRTPRSIYREVLFLTLVALGQDNIDLTAFDREYRRAFEKLPSKYDSLVHKCDRPPSVTTNICRKLFRELKL